MGIGRVRIGRDRGTPDDETDDRWVEGDYHLQPGSPAIGAGTPQGIPVDDLDGHARLCGEGVDLGAYEWGGCPLPSGVRFVRGDATGDGRIDLSDAIGLLLALYAGQATDCEDALDANDDGRLDTSDAIRIVDYLYRDGPDLPEPFLRASPDPSGEDALGCRR